MLALTTSGLVSGSYERFLWAVGTVRARTHAPLDGAASALVPLADLVTALSYRPISVCTCPTAELFAMYGRVPEHGIPKSFFSSGMPKLRAALTFK